MLTAHTRRRSRHLFVVVAVLTATILILQAHRPRKLISAEGNDLSPPTATAGDELARVIDVQDRSTETLMQIQGVVGTATGIDFGGRPRILILAERAGVDVPRTIEGVPVKVYVTGRLSAPRTVRLVSGNWFSKLYRARAHWRRRGKRRWHICGRHHRLPSCRCTWETLRAQ